MLSKNLFDEKTLEVNFISDYLTVTTPLPQYLPYEKLWGEVSKVLRELSELVAK